MRRFLWVAVAAAVLVGCTDAEEAKRAVENIGGTDVKITGFRFFGCDREGFRTGFTATSATGKRISGVVCSGWFKGATVRFD